MASANLESALSGVQVSGSLSDPNACHEKVVEEPKVISQLVDTVYLLNKRRNDEAKMVWEKIGYQPISWNAQQQTAAIWYVVFLKTLSCPYTKAAQVVIAVRGTSLTKLADFYSNIKLIKQVLKRDKRYEELQVETDRIVKWYGHMNVAVAGHSLGASFALLVGKVMCKAMKPVETYCFNPPLISFDLVSSPTLRSLWRGCKVMHVGILRLLGSSAGRRRCMVVRKEFSRLAAAKWTPHFFLNMGDYINLAYINQFIDKVGVSESGFRAWIDKWVAPHSLLSLLFDDREPFRVPSANHTIVPALGNPLSSHGVKQWHGDPLWQSGTEVERLTFGRQLLQRLYILQREKYTVKNSDVDVIAYCQQTAYKYVQAAASTATLGVATSRQKQVILLCNTKQDAQAVRSWPSELQYMDINGYIARDRSLKFRFQKIRKGATTFYVYAVRHTEAVFHRELEFRWLLNKIWKMPDETNWIRLFQLGLLAAATFPAAVLLP